jgi:hypothetical protein
MQHVVVPEPHDAPTEALYFLLTQMVPQVLLVLVVDSSVELDHQPQLFAGEVGIEPVDRMLSAKLQTFKATASDRLPELMFRKRLALPEVAGAVGRRVAHRTP